MPETHNSGGQKAGRPRRGKTVFRSTVMLPPCLHEWAMRQPDGLSGVIRRLLREEIARQHKEGAWKPTN